MDAAVVADQLWTSWLPNSIRAQLAESVGGSDESARVLVRWLAAGHDVGKASPAFAVQVDHLADHARDAGLKVTLHQDRAMARHETVSQIALRSWLEGHFDLPDRKSRRRAFTYADVASGHHGRWAGSDVIGKIETTTALIGDQAWADVRDELIDAVTSFTGAEPYIERWIERLLTVEARMLLTGIVIIADWIASNGDLFSYERPYAAAAERADQALIDLALPGPWRPQADAQIQPALARRFPHLDRLQPRDIQRVAFECARAQTGPALLIIEASTGGGKTEAGLLAAEALAVKTGSGGIFFGLPTMATTDAMFMRVHKWVETQAGTHLSISLVHSKSYLNEDLQDLRRRTHSSSIAQDVTDETTGAKGESQVAEANAWLSGRHKALLANMSVGTIDQVLRAALKSKYVVLRHLAIAGKTIIIDEVHAADAYMRQFLVALLKWLGRYGASVVLMSATLPMAQRQEFCAAYADGLGAPPPKVSNNAYPLVTATSTAGTTEHPVESSESERIIQVRQIRDEMDDLTNAIADRLTDGGCIAVVRNTVGRAQSAALAIQSALPEAEVILVHSRFLASERLRREAALRTRLGPGDDDRPRTLIVVGTQVLEQSLDVDFDLMFSDIAPIDLLIQRIGRLHRHQRSARPLKLAEPQLILTGITGIDAAGVPAFDRGIQAVYQLAPLLRSYLLLGLSVNADRDLRLPTENRSLIEAAYGDIDAPDNAWREALDAADSKWKKTLDELRDRARSFVLEPPKTEPDQPMYKFLGDPGDLSEERGWGVRDGDDGIEVLVVRRAPDGWHVMPGDHRSADETLPFEHETPSWHQASALARTTLKLPGAMCKPWSIDPVIRDLERNGLASWQESPLLRGQLVLVLDDDLTATVADHHLRYDADLGLIHSKGNQA
ncbi:CRISPR-associated helicase Cas3' [Epidermidibacterium keratini]